MAIFEERIYTLKTGLVADYLALYEAKGKTVHERALGPPVGWFFSEIGVLNQIVILWRYESHADRERRRAALAADLDWQAFLPLTRAYIERMENRILVAAPFSPLQ